MDVTEAIRLKRAVREFAPVPLPNDVVHASSAAGRRAQSSKNTQPWQFIAIRDRKTLEDLSRLGTYAGHLAGAALGVAILTPDPAERWSSCSTPARLPPTCSSPPGNSASAPCIATIYEPEAARALLGSPGHGTCMSPSLSATRPTQRSWRHHLVPGGRRALDEIVPPTSAGSLTSGGDHSDEAKAPFPSTALAIATLLTATIGCRLSPSSCPPPHQRPPTPRPPHPRLTPTPFPTATSTPIPVIARHPARWLDRLHG